MEKLGSLGLWWSHSIRICCQLLILELSMKGHTSAPGLPLFSLFPPDSLLPPHSYTWKMGFSLCPPRKFFWFFTPLAVLIFELFTFKFWQIQSGKERWELHVEMVKTKGSWKYVTQIRGESEKSGEDWRLLKHPFCLLFALIQIQFSGIHLQLTRTWGGQAIHRRSQQASMFDHGINNWEHNSKTSVNRGKQRKVRSGGAGGPGRLLGQKLNLTCNFTPLVYLNAINTQLIPKSVVCGYHPGPLDLHSLFLIFNLILNVNPSTNVLFKDTRFKLSLTFPTWGIVIRIPARADSLQIWFLLSIIDQHSCLPPNSYSGRKWDSDIRM